MAAHRDLLKELKQAGCTIFQAANGHLKVLRPNGSYAMTMSLSPSDKNATNKARQLARRLNLLDN